MSTLRKEFFYATGAGVLCDNEKLKEKYGQHPRVSRIARHRQVPKHVKSAQAELKLIKESSKRKEANRRKHSKPGAVPHVPEREAHTVDEME